MTSQAVRILKAGADLAQKFWRGHCPVSPFITEYIFSVLQNWEKYECHIGLYLKFIISTVANSVMGWALRPIETRTEGPRAG